MRGMKQIDAGVLNVGYAEAGPTDGPAVILLHGWPYDIHSYVDVASLPAEAGYRAIVPYLRGYGTTSFPSETFRNGQQSILADLTREGKEDPCRARFTTVALGAPPCRLPAPRNAFATPPW